MTHGNIHERPDLTSLFGELDPEEAEKLTDTLLALDERLDQLAQQASEHVGVAFRNAGLTVASTGIAGGPWGDAGDIWFDISPEPPSSASGPPWEVWSYISVFCDRTLRGETRGYSCTHDLFSLIGLTATVPEAVSVMAEHIESLAAEVKKRNPADFLGAPHEALPENDVHD